MDKNTLRKVYLEKRKFLSSAEYEKRNRLVLHQLIDFFNQFRFNSIHIYIPIKKNKEVDTFPFIQYLWTKKPDIKVVTGASKLESPEMKHMEIFQHTTFLENKWGIPEPKDGARFPIKAIDCILIPMIVGSKSGHRIGYGKGYYDRFLSDCSSLTKFIGLSMVPLLDGNVYADEHDIQLDTIITPFEVHEVRKESYR